MEEKYEVRDAKLVCDTLLETNYEGARSGNADVCHVMTKTSCKGKR